MNYRESRKIKEGIKKADKILVNAHRSPDPDSIGCALAMYKVLKNMGKNVDIICPDEVNGEYDFLADKDEIRKVDYSSFDYTSYDLFITLDSSSWNMVTRDKGIEIFDMPIVVIDHHKSNKLYGEVNLVDDKVSSTAEVLFLVFEDWGVELDKAAATYLLAGILGDTGVFRYPSVTPQTMDVARSLMEKGADKDEIIFNVFSTIDFELLKFWGEVLRRMRKEKNFVWSAIPYEVFEEYGSPLSGKESAASSFAQIAKDTDFGLIIVEERPGTLAISLRSRSGADVSLLAERLGGGGHRGAAGAKLESKDFGSGLKKILKEAEKFAKEIK
jgi:phosphoesterase RecJ-like protein